MKYYSTIFVFVFIIIKPFLIQAQPIPVEERLAGINVILSELPSKREQVREWLLSDPAYRILARNVLKQVGNNKIIHKIPLDVINGKFKFLMGRSYNGYIPPEKYEHPELIRRAILKTWKERHIGSSRNSFDQILLNLHKKDLSSPSKGTLVVIEVEYPKPSDEIPIPEFIGKGKVVSKVQPQNNTYLYSVIKTNKYYRQDSQKLIYFQADNVWYATWELDLILGRPADIGLEGTLYLFVADKKNRKKFVKYYMYPKEKPHSKKDILTIASSELHIERAIPE